LSSSADADDRRKVAEAFAGHAKAEPTLVKLLADADAGVRANAAWALATVGGAGAINGLATAVRDVDVAVAGNAALALARATTRAKQPSSATAPLCGALSDFRSYVRAAALTGLRENAQSCPAPKRGRADVIRHILRRDKSWRTRLAAAKLVAARKAQGAAGDLDKRALARCAAEDRDAGVAAQCARTGPVAARSAERHEVLVYVVPDGKTAPSPRAPFALVFADDAMRLGVADRRGAAFEIAAPEGALSLAVPAALAR
jgi:cellulose synthase operon protein C